MNQIRGSFFQGILLCTLLLLMACRSAHQSNRLEDAREVSAIFPKGTKVSNEHFTGNVWLTYLAPSDSVYNVVIGSVSFEPGARTHWHYHPGGQILLITEGEGWYQEKGEPVEIIKKGDVIKCPPAIEHWHGASKDQSMTHIAIGTNSNLGGAVWLHPVTDKEYFSGDF